jgi:hypothetical protein
LNDRLVKDTGRGTVRHANRLFERIDARTVCELPLPGKPLLTTGRLELPNALLAEPWLSEYRVLRDELELARS